MFQITISPEEIDKLELTAFPGEVHVISHPGIEFSKAISYLRKQSVIGFDTETKPVFNHDQHSNGVALLQLSGPDRAFLFRVQKLGLRGRICAILSNPNIIKVGAACNDDIRGLQRLREFEPRGFVDLQKIVWEWGIRDKGVRKMAANILGVKVSKSQQLSNWEAETLTDAQRKYASTDAWICREMYLKLLNSEKNPLPADQMLPPEQQPGHGKKVKPAPAEHQKKTDDGRARRKHKKHRKRSKKTKDEKSIPPEGA